MMVDQVEIHMKSTSSGMSERVDAVRLLRNNFVYLPDRKQAEDDLYRLSHNDSWFVRRNAVGALGIIFQHIPESRKKRAWEELCNIVARDKTESVQRSVAEALGTIFEHIPDKEQALEGLCQLVHNEDRYVRRNAAVVVSNAFPYITDKEKVWKCLHRLAYDTDGYVRRGVAGVLGYAFPYITDEEKAWNCLHHLARDKHWYVRISANHSLGRASIFKATEAESEENFRKELEKALKFFETSSKEATYYRRPSSFCLPFYRSFYAITFEETGAEDEVQKYLGEAKNASEGSENRKTLLGAVKNLANALKEAHRATDFDDAKFDLYACWEYCERAADLIGVAEEEAPGAARVLRRALPIIKKKIKKITSEIQEKSNALCEQTRGTPFEDLGEEVNRIGTNYSKIRDPTGLKKNTEILMTALTAICDRMPEEEIEGACDLLKKAREEGCIEDKLPLINIFLDKIPILITEVTIIEEDIREIVDRIDAKTDKIIEYIQKIGISYNRIVYNLEKGGVKLKEEEKEELKNLADDLKRANKEQLNNFTNELIKWIKDSRRQEEIEKTSEKHKPKIKKTFSEIKRMLNELGIALSAAVTAEELLPHIEAIMHQITILSEINPGLASTLILIPLITIKETLK